MTKIIGADAKRNLTRIGVFYDGNYFYHVSNYYNYVHDKQSRISIAGLHNFIRQKVSDLEGDSKDIHRCQIVDAHYFRGRLNAMEASQKGNQLYYERVFDDILMSEGVTTHYFPVKSVNGQRQEREVDLWLALEAFELALYKQFDILVLLASDGNYVPLARKLNTLGTRVMLLSWDFEFRDDYGNQRVTRTSQDLLDVVTYPVPMHELINGRSERDRLLVSSLFVPKDNNSYSRKPAPEVDFGNEDVHVSSILSVKSGYGFIKYPPTNLFFHFQSVNGCDFYDLEPGDKVQFRVARNEKGDDVAIDVELVE
ncbi:NYN domain-containing protein [Alkaliflexus imshenetskii]|uniref:NYN domain-containing protein n=1 Tax=Alkaliflexus imshenetskii TaxID=286730 RepID=UPI0004BAC193|nr:NYN domain-containing protein [Alkaliflexus imshenetskii]